MIEEKQYIFSLVDTYEDLLTDRQKEVIHDYYYNDFSLNEIAESLGITKQAVKDSIDKAIKNLNRYEDALHLVDKQIKFKSLMQRKVDLNPLDYATMLENLFKE